MAEAKLEQLLTEMPKLHYWSGAWNAGGLWPDAVRLMIRHAFHNGASEKVIMETGAGLSTLAFLTRGPKQVISIAPDKQLFERIRLEAARLEIAIESLLAYEEFSELCLPRIVLEREPFVDFGFIDGGHNFTSVWVDFVYVNYALKLGAVLGIDDIQLYSCRSLALYLKNCDDWKQLDGNLKTAYFQKNNTRRLERDFGASKLITMNTL